MKQSASQELVLEPHAASVGVDLNTAYPLDSVVPNSTMQWRHRIRVGFLPRRPCPGLINMHLSLDFLKMGFYSMYPRMF